MKLKTIYASLKKDLSFIESELEQTVNAHHPVLRDASNHLLKAGGKRIRPVFVLLSGKFGDYNLVLMKNVAVALELIHMASLVHDDVIDDAEMRRGTKTIKAKWDNRVAMYTGDYIFARAVELVTELKDPAANTILSNAILEMSIGEIEQIKDQFNWDQNVRDYFRRIKRKTALLIATSCELGAVAAGASKAEQQHLKQFGYYVGMSYQITDDILDYTGTVKELGKPAGGDLLQGNITLPVLYAMNQGNMKREIMNIFSKELNTSQEKVNQVISIVKSSGGIEFSQRISDRYLQKAFNELEQLPAQSATTSLRQIAEYIGKRKH
ncbi:heptaprenyl diphosphate synthase component II [Pseudalkalibacillus hwajinpoensis]|uniref:Heptaprenyl diphosphate synthase component 2 n=1 Tax=Guptibacillus hwajinpoensis TaxID=208199 RepID=A0A4U1MHP9_9BACL|nr:heptaprenyl diphosphate synthase component II [Pseudalkalibacillus hwajinpoensis]TKD69850.1 heptaprenyl diphosphate synthase component II [Pseudalkalibacillus hwajinpoensis]